MSLSRKPTKEEVRELERLSAELVDKLLVFGANRAQFKILRHDRIFLVNVESYTNQGLVFTEKAQ